MIVIYQIRYIERKKGDEQFPKFDLVEPMYPERKRGPRPPVFFAPALLYGLNRTETCPSLGGIHRAKTCPNI